MQTRPLYQQQKKEKSISIVTWALVTSWLVIFAGIWWVFYGQHSADTPEILPEVQLPSLDTTDTQEPIKQYYMGENILMQGSMEATDTFTTYTHDFTNDAGEVFGLKSKDMDLYQYDGNVQLKGSITDFKKDLPIIQVNEIVGDTDTPLAADAEGKESFRLFIRNKIGVDLSPVEGYDAVSVGDEIHIVDTTADDSIVLKISPFVCTPGDALKDCDVLRKNFEAIGSDRFVSSHDLTFYNLSETITRVAFDPTGTHGYYATPTDDTQLTSFANLLIPMSEERFRDSLSTAWQDCKNLEYSMDDPDAISYDYVRPGVVYAELTQTASDTSVLTCEFSIKLASTLSPQKLSFRVKSGAGDTPPTVDAEKDLAGVPDDTVEEDTEDEDNGVVIEENIQEVIAAPENVSSSVPANWSGSGWFKHSSIRGYDMYFSSKSISFAGNILSTPVNLGVDGLSCIYKTNLIHWKRADEVATSPDVEVYECLGVLPANSENLQQVGSAGGKIFVSKRYTSNLGSMSIIIE